MIRRHERPEYRYRRHTRTGVQAPRTHIAAGRAPRRVGTDDTRGRGTGPSRASIKTLSTWVSVPRIGTDDAVRGGTAPTHSRNCRCYTASSVPRGRCRRPSLEGVQAPPTRPAAGRASRGVGIDDARGRGYDARGRGYRPHAREQQRIKNLNESPADRYKRPPREGVQAPRARTPTGAKLNQASREAGTETLAEGGAGPTHSNSVRQDVPQSRCR